MSGWQCVTAWGSVGVAPAGRMPSPPQMVVCIAAAAGTFGAVLVSHTTGAETAPLGDKPLAAGIFCLMHADRVDRPVRNLAGRPAWRQGYVDGFALRTFRDRVEPALGQLDWTPFDEGVALARKHGRSLALSLAASMRTAAWVYAAGATKFPFTWTTHFAPQREAVMPGPGRPADQ